LQYIALEKNTDCTVSPFSGNKWVFYSLPYTTMENTTLQNIIKNDVFSNQTALLTKLLGKDEIITHDDIYNIYNEETDEYVEIFEYYAISQRLCDKLNQEGASVIDSPYGCWYARQET
jgi:hypothetical protein